MILTTSMKKRSLLGRNRRAERDAPRATAHTPRSTGTAQLTRDKTHHSSHRPPAIARPTPQSTQTPLSASAAHATAVAWPTPIARRISDAAASCTATEMRCITNGMYLRVDHVASVSYSPCASACWHVPQPCLCEQLEQRAAPGAP